MEMRRGQLRDYFTGVGVKRLTAVDAERARSNQHEVGTTRDMRDQFCREEPRRDNPTVYIWLGEDQDGYTVEGTATHYDTREYQLRRSPRGASLLPFNPVTEVMREGDTLFLAMNGDGLLYFVVASAGSTSERQLSWLFGLRPEGQSFVSREFLDDEPELDFAARYILDELGIEFEEPDADKLDAIIERFGTAFPKTAEFSATARVTLPDVQAEDDPDAAHTCLAEPRGGAVSPSRETGGLRPPGGWFCRRRRSRCGRFHPVLPQRPEQAEVADGLCAENHLEAIFKGFNIAHVRGAKTEHSYRPDFLFPGAEAYHAAPAAGAACLAMLGAKSTCKDRWRQVLVEAAKIPRKHLLTLEPGISEAQTDQMAGSDLQLVVPRSIQGSYTERQCLWLWDLGDFIRPRRDVRGLTGARCSLPSLGVSGLAGNESGWSPGSPG